MKTPQINDVVKLLGCKVAVVTAVNEKTGEVSVRVFSGSSAVAISKKGFEAAAEIIGNLKIAGTFTGN